jgi:RNA recognition motif-containing protein
VGAATPGAVAPKSTRDIPDEAKLFVAGLPPTMTNEMLLSIFSPYGEVRWAAMLCMLPLPFERVTDRGRP